MRRVDSDNGGRKQESDAMGERVQIASKLVAATYADARAAVGQASTRYYRGNRNWFAVTGREHLALYSRTDHPYCKSSARLFAQPKLRVRVLNATVHRPAFADTTRRQAVARAFRVCHSRIDDGQWVELAPVYGAEVPARRQSVSVMADSMHHSAASMTGTQLEPLSDEIDSRLAGVDASEIQSVRQSDGTVSQTEGYFCFRNPAGEPLRFLDGPPLTNALSVPIARDGSILCDVDELERAPERSGRSSWPDKPLRKGQ
ncbi:uncharacterized protein L969DRAFT_42321 [Mixia osmundae IAM 14324]|uniref:Uncharacterized protein n=1 Tax=Mixia osmundae (strain CBS 9802 / IAM 14324 / JCM 22182 / KY 12970) TaxID=764103 RepID=G7E3Z0_MIXOS|nr:uncharacterized protein L969DRAFT_42321 [Mixia osmundae IAM 14324]KEI41997.1 hypothetical protein L969DRAFT_42321 [Mixia osmundae IAM 14324]GAA97550.1 hypothetical protein E5Q_04228 [Mixia osmundae IAM 14324]